MSELSKFSPDYKTWIGELKFKIRSVQIKTAVAVNSALISFYWDLGKMIAEKQRTVDWGDKLIDQIASDLKDEFPEMNGFSASNLKYCKRFYLFYNSSDFSIGQQAVDQIPWGHNILIFSKSNTTLEANFYIQQTIENNWSRNVLANQIKSDLYNRIGKSVNNFNRKRTQKLIKSWKSQ